jgi:methyl-accepting chemotaxis protein
MLNRFKLSTRILLLGIIMVACFSAVFAGLFPKVKQIMLDGKYLKTRHVVETAWGILDYHAKKVKANAVSLEEAKLRAMEEIKLLRYEGDEYFWINDMEPRMIMHPFKSELDGKNLSNNKDPNGKALFVAMVETVRSNGAGFVDYYWPKPGHAQPVPKISYVKGFPEWGWVIGSGIYLDDVQKELNQILYVIFAVVIVATVGGLFLAYGMARSISRPIDHIIVDLDDAADRFASASGQISSASQQLAEGASEQASAIEETSSSLEEMSSMTKQNANNSTQANQLMKGTKETVSRAGQSMEKLSTSMGEISTAGEETSKIIKTIDEIAFQTNLLALNAAVEAARAGESGAGFAVVADEVRNLAMRAAEAAKNTAYLIEGTVKKVHEGFEMVGKTEQEFREVAVGVEKSSQLVGEITAASQEQALGIEQINKAVSEMDKVVQQTAANSEEAAAASEEMSGQAEQLRRFVRELKTLVGGLKSNGVAGSTQSMNKKSVARKIGRSPSTAVAVHGKQGNGNGKGFGHLKKIGTRAEQLIPLDGEVSDF